MAKHLPSANCLALDAGSVAAMSALFASWLKMDVVELTRELFAWLPDLAEQVLAVFTKDRWRVDEFRLQFVWVFWL